MRFHDKMMVQEETMPAAMQTRSAARPATLESAFHRTPRKHVEAFPLANLIIDPRENYRWGSEEAMRADLAATSRDPSTGVQVCSYEMLKDSIKSLGVEEPIGVVPRADGTYRIVYGFTRALAAKELGLGAIPAYVYDPSLPEEEAQLLQLRENSIGLKRPVNWVVEVETYLRLLEYTRASIEAVPFHQRPRGDDGKVMSVKEAAISIVSKMLGVSGATMKNRAYHLRHMPASVVKLSREGHLSASAATEFYSGDSKVPFAAEFVDAVLADLKSRPGGYAAATSETVKQAMRRVKEASGKPVFEGGKKPSTLGSNIPAAGRHGSGLLRDMCVALWRGYLDRTKLVQASPDKAWADLARGRVWYTVVGIGIGAADVSEPVVQAGDDTGLAERRHEETAFHYAMSTFLQAFLAAELSVDAESFRDWLNGFTSVGGTRLLNRVEFHAAIAAALENVVPRTANLKAIAATARSELKERLGV